MALIFTLFNNLPFELRHLVWQLSLPDDQPYEEWGRSSAAYAGRYGIPGAHSRVP